MVLTLAEYRPSDWKSLERDIKDAGVRERAFQSLKLTLDDAKPDGGAISDELDRIARKLTRIRFWSWFPTIKVAGLFRLAEAETTKIFAARVPEPLATALKGGVGVGPLAMPIGVGDDEVVYVADPMLQTGRDVRRSIRQNLFSGDEEYDPLAALAKAVGYSPTSHYKVVSVGKGYSVLVVDEHGNALPHHPVSLHGMPLQDIKPMPPRPVRERTKSK